VISCPQIKDGVSKSECEQLQGEEVVGSGSVQFVVLVCNVSLSCKERVLLDHFQQVTTLIPAPLPPCTPGSRSQPPDLVIAKLPQ